MERLTEWTGYEWIPRQERLTGKIIGHRPCMERLAAYENTGLTPEEIMEGKLLTGWIPVEERLPKTEDGYAYVMVSMDDGFVCTTDYTENDGFELWADSGEVLAWMPLPEPYRPEQREE